MTEDGAKEWVTVKVPREDKERADEYRPDGSTFGDCLVAGAERLNDHMDSDTRRFEPDGATVNADELADEIVWRIDMAADPGAPVTDDDVAELNEKVRRLQELVEQTPERTADELEGRLR